MRASVNALRLYGNRLRSWGRLMGCMGVLFAMWMPAMALANIHADVDDLAISLPMPRALIDPQVYTAQASYFLWPIPKQIHRIHFGGADAAVSGVDSSWASYSESLGYHLTLWTSEQLAELEAMMQPDLYAAVQAAIHLGHWRYASQLARTAIVAAQGGIFIDDLLWPPHNHQGWSDFDHIVPMRGLVMMTEWLGRNIGRTSFFGSDSLLAAAAGHPLLEHVNQHSAANHSQVMGQQGNFVEGYGAGSYVINRALGGAITVVPINHLQSLGMLDGGAEAQALTEATLNAP